MSSNAHDSRQHRAQGASRYTAGLLLLSLAAWLLVPGQAQANEVAGLSGFNSSPVATPAHATSRTHTVDEDAVAPLSIDTPKDGRYYFIKLQRLPGCNTLSQSIAPDFVVPDCDTIDVFVHGGETVKLAVPEGEYIVKYASGRDWYGYQYLFGPRGTYSVGEATLEFKLQEDGRAQGYTLKLYKVVDGNLKTDKLNWGQF